jgi:hypothetical protein
MGSNISTVEGHKQKLRYQSDYSLWYSDTPGPAKELSLILVEAKTLGLARSDDVQVLASLER